MYLNVIIFCIFIIPVHLRWYGDLPDVNQPKYTDPVELSHAKSETIIRTDLTINKAAIKPLPENISVRNNIIRKSTEIYNNAITLYESGKALEAIQQFIESIEINPHFTQSWHILANIWKALQRYEAALEFAKQSCIESNVQCEAFLANLYLELRTMAKDPTEQHRLLLLGVEHYKRAVDPQKDYKLKLQLASVFIEAGMYKEALLETKKAARLSPKNEEVYSQMGLVYKNMLLYEQSKQSYLKSIQLNPKSTTGYKGLSLLYQYVYFDIANAITNHKKAIELEPNDVTSLHNLGSAYNMVGYLNEAITMYDRVLKTDPNLKQTFMEVVNLRARVCDWKKRDDEMKKTINQVKDELETGSSVTLASWYATNYPISAKMLKDIAVAYSNTLIPLYEALPQPFTYPSKRPNDPIKIGIVSSDIGDTNVGRDILGWLMHRHKPEKIHLTFYAGRADDGTIWRKFISENANQFVDVSSYSHYDMAKRINDDGIHILINLNGYTKHSKNEMFALRPAPIQINMKGYPGTLGAPWVQYILTDKNVTPLSNQEFFTEKYIYMPNSYFLSSYPDVFGHVINSSLKSQHSLTSIDLPADLQNFIFCDFNHLIKVEPEVFRVWMKILSRVPNSIMWFLSLPKEAENNLKAEAEKYHIDPERLVFRDMYPLEDHLIVKSFCHLFLDTLIFNGHGTVMDILWAGVPIITKMGETLQSRAAGSYVMTLGIPEMIVGSLQEYEEKAVEWANDYQNGGRKLLDIREKIERNRLTSPLFDTKRWVRDWEIAMEMIWQNYEQKKGFENIVVPNNPWDTTIDQWSNDQINRKFWK